MCSNYFPTVIRERLASFGVQPDLDLGLLTKPQVWPHYRAPMVRPASGGAPGAGREVVLGEFGLVPEWSKQRTNKYATFNARSETVATLASYKGPWARGQRCIVPADVVVEPDWRSGKNIPTGIRRADDEPMGIAGLWDQWLDRETGEILLSFTMLTINADGHALMRNFHRPGDEKRMVVILPEAAYDAWLSGSVHDARALLQPFAADALVADPLASRQRDGQV